MVHRTKAIIGGNVHDRKHCQLQTSGSSVMLASVMCQQQSVYHNLPHYSINNNEDHASKGRLYVFHYNNTKYINSFAIILQL